MSYNGLTNQGLEYLTRCQVESKPVVFSKVKIGNGNIPMGSTGETTTDLYSFKKEIEILNKEQVENSIKMEILINNFDVLEEFYVKEIGVYVMDNDVEKLYWYINKDRPSPLPDKNTPAKHRYILHLETSQMESIILNYTGLDLMVDKEFVETRFKEAKERIKAVQFPNVESLKLKNLKVGDIVEVLGYYTAGDGAGHKRIISDTDDGSGVQLNNKLWANIIHNGEVNVSWLGCKYNSLESARTNYTNLLKAINYNQTVDITGDLYVEQSGDNIVTSENLILKGKDKVKLILCTNFEKTDWFVINKNLKNLSFTDLEVKFNGTAERTSVLFAIDGMIKVNNCDIENCVFNINSNGRLMSWTNANTNIKPDLSLHGFDVFNLKNNTFNNILNSFIVLNDVIYRELNIINNKINNFYYTFISCGTTNENTFGKEIIDNKLLTNVYNNTVINDDNFILNEGVEANYYCFALFEANVINYKNNYIEGIKSQDICALYDSYFGGNYLYYENNTWKNNLCFNINKVNNNLIKSKSVINKYYRNNTYIIKEEWLTKFNVDEKARWIYLDEQTSLADNTVINNNVFEVYEIRFYPSTPKRTNCTFSNNKFKIKKSSNPIFLYGVNDEKLKNSNFIVENNIFFLGNLKSNNLIATFENKFHYNKIIISNNEFYYKLDDTINIFYVLFNDFNANTVQFSNNKFIETEKNLSSTCNLISSYKGINSNKFIGTNNVFSSEVKDDLYTFSMFDIIPKNKTDIKFEYINIASSKLAGIFYSDISNRLDKADIPKIDYKIKISLKNKDSIDKVYYLIFSLEKINNEEHMRAYNSLGNIEDNVVNLSSSSTIWKNLYLLDDKGAITKEFINLNINNNILVFFFNDKICDELGFDFRIIGG